MHDVGRIYLNITKIKRHRLVLSYKKLEDLGYPCKERQG